MIGGIIFVVVAELYKNNEFCLRFVWSLISRDGEEEDSQGSCTTTEEA